MILTMVSSEVADDHGSRAVGLGQATLGTAGQTLWTVLGSCVGIAIADPQEQLSALAHVVLPMSSGRVFSPSKFADTAVPQLVQLMEQAGAQRKNLVAKLAGGARMFGNNEEHHLGQANTYSARAALEKAGIPLLAERVGGARGRRISLDCTTGILRVEELGKTAVLL